MERQNWIQLTTVQAGGAICLPVFVIGYALGKNYGIASAALAIVLGNALLLTLAFVSGVYSSQKRLSTVQCAIACFGEKGKGMFSAAMVLSMTGWFAIQLHLMGESLSLLIPSWNGIAATLCMGVVMTALGTKGLRGVGMLANISMPLLLLTIVMGLMGVEKGEASSDDVQFLTTSGMSLVLACSIGVVVDLPTFFRSAKSRKDAVAAVCVLFALVIPAVEMVGVIISASGAGEGFLDVLMGESPSGAWKLWVLGFVLMAGWTTNSANLYSAVVSLEPVMPSTAFSSRTWLVGLLGTFAAVLPLLEGLELVLQPIGIILTSMGAVMISSFVTGRKSAAAQNFTAWMVGAGAGLLSLMTVSITGIAALDGFIASLFTISAFRGLQALSKENLIYENDR